MTLGLGSSRGNSQAEAPSPSPREAGARGPEKTTEIKSRTRLNHADFIEWLVKQYRPKRIRFTASRLPLDIGLSGRILREF